MIEVKMQIKGYLNGQVFFTKSNESFNSWVALFSIFM